MEDFDEDQICETWEEQGIYINGIKYLYSINLSDKKNDSITIKLYNPKEKSDLYYICESHISKIKEEVEFLSSYNNLEEIIDSLNRVFSEGNIKAKEKNGELILELKECESELEKIGIIKLIRSDINQSKNELEEKIETLENKYEDLLNTVEELKIAKENALNKNEVKNIIKEVLFDKEIKNKLFEDMEQMFLSKYNFNNIPKKPKEDENVEEKIIEKVKEVANNKEEKINNKIILLEEQLRENIDYLKEIKTNIDKTNASNNYIELQVLINEENLKKDIKLFNQANTYKYFCNFEIEDIETIIDNKIVQIKYKNSNGDFKYYGNSKNCELSQEIDHNLSSHYFYWNFSSTGMHTVKIIFKKKLIKCNQLFYDCPYIYKIDCSNFDYSKVYDCSKMFSAKKVYFFGKKGSSSLAEINLGKLDFTLANKFSDIFYGCNNLQKLDAANLNTNNVKGLDGIFSDCLKLKEIILKKNSNKNLIKHLPKDCKINFK